MRCAKRLTEGRHSCAAQIGVAEHQNGLGNQQVHQHQQVYRRSTIIDVSEHHQRVDDGKDTTVWRDTSTATATTPTLRRSGPPARRRAPGGHVDEQGPLQHQVTRPTGSSASTRPSARTRPWRGNEVLERPATPTAVIVNARYISYVVAEDECDRRSVHGVRGGVWNGATEGYSHERVVVMSMGVLG